MSKKTTTVLFLGAGASAAFGFPLTSQILPALRRGLKERRLFGPGHEDQQDRLAAFLIDIFPGFNDLPDTKLPLITDVLSLIDYSIHTLSAPAPKREVNGLIEFRLLLERAIADSVSEWPYKEGGEPDALRNLTTWLHEEGRDPHRHIGIITSNYDLAMETELLWTYKTDEQVARDFDFGFSWRTTATGTYGRIMMRPSEPKWCFYKLHGSVNWLRCDRCEYVYINTDASIVDWAYEKLHQANECHCQHGRLRPILVAPSMVRDVRDVNLLEVWKHAGELLRTAEHWVLVGYSFPPEDLAIRSMFVRAYNRPHRPRIQVIQKVPTDRIDDDPVRPRYELLFPGCQYHTDGLEGFASRLTVKANPRLASDNRRQHVHPRASTR